MKIIARRTMDAAFLNEVANHPEVRPWLGGDGPLDLSPATGNPANFALLYAHGGFLLEPLEPGSYELHTMFTPEQRGARFFVALWDMLRFMFTHTDCLEIVTKCPDDNPAARMAALKVGFRERFRREDAWKPGVGVSFQSLNIDGWFVRDEANLKAGQRFHTDLDALAKRDGITLPAHPEDEAHDRAAGAAYLMILAGSVNKGVGFYRRWALFAGYPDIKLLPTGLIDMHEAVVEVVGGEMNAVLWRPPGPVSFPG